MSTGLLVKKSRTVTLTFTTNYTTPTLSFGTQYDLNGVQVLGLQVYTRESLPVSENGNQVLTYAQCQGILLNLYTNDPDSTKTDDNGTVISQNEGLYIYNKPLVSLIAMVNNSTATLQPYAPELFRMAGQAIQWGKSGLNIKVPVGNTGGPVDFVMEVFYQGLSQG